MSQSNAGEFFAGLEGASPSLDVLSNATADLYRLNETVFGLLVAQANYEAHPPTTLISPDEPITKTTHATPEGLVVSAVPELIDLDWRGIVSVARTTRDLLDGPEAEPFDRTTTYGITILDGGTTTTWAAVRQRQTEAASPTQVDPSTPLWEGVVADDPEGSTRQSVLRPARYRRGLLVAGRVLNGMHRQLEPDTALPADFFDRF